MRAENFIYFATVSGFFISILFGIIKDFDAFNLLFAVVFITSLFYIVALASISFFIKYTTFKQNVFFNKEEVEMVVDTQIKELEKKENFIYENYKFLKKFEAEEYKILKSNNV